MILCVCRRGNVRSATCATVLKDCFGRSDVFAAGLETTTYVVMDMLGKMSTDIYVVGEQDLLVNFLSRYPQLESRAHLLNVGDDRWAVPMHPDLVRHILDELNAFGFAMFPPLSYSSTDKYLDAVLKVWIEKHE